MSSATGKMFVLFLSVRELAVTIHLTGFFFPHTPKLLQPQLRKPGKLQAGDTEVHTSLNSLLYRLIAFTYCFLLFLNVTSIARVGKMSL